MHPPHEDSQNDEFARRSFYDWLPNLCWQSTVLKSFKRKESSISQKPFEFIQKKQR
jgi:hypothetical protein